DRHLPHRRRPLLTRAHRLEPPARLPIPGPRAPTPSPQHPTPKTHHPPHRARRGRRARRGARRGAVGADVGADPPVGAPRRPCPAIFPLLLPAAAAPAPAHLSLPPG